MTNRCVIKTLKQYEIGIIIVLNQNKAYKLFKVRRARQVPEKLPVLYSF